MKNRTKILYLAKYAPETIYSPIPTGIEDTTYAVYHHKIFETLSNSFSHVESCSNIEKIIQNKPDADFIFSLYNRLPFRNSEIFISSLAEYYHIPYLGATPNIRAIAEDKQLAKIIAKQLNIDTAPWCICNIGQKMKKLPFKGPYFVKPRFGSSSKYIDTSSYCENYQEVKQQVSRYHNKNIDVIIERYIEGISITVPILNNFGDTLILPIIYESTSTAHNIITYEQKRKITTGLKRIINTNNTFHNEISVIANKFFASVQPLDYTRLDFIIEKSSNKPYFIEFNVCCNLGEHAAINQAATSIHVDYQSLIDNIIFSSMFRQNIISNTYGKKF